MVFGKTTEREIKLEKCAKEKANMQINYVVSPCLLVAYLCSVVPAHDSASRTVSIQRGESALHLAARQCDYKIVKYLVEQGLIQFLLPSTGFV